MPVPEPADDTALDVQFPRRRERVAFARAATRRTLAAWGVPAEAAEAVVLVVSELVTNAIRHTRGTPGGEIALRVTRAGAHRVRVEVSDAGDTLPRQRAAAPDDESHRGLALVAALTARHGAGPRPQGAGKTVWAEVDAADFGE